jgi:Phage terminase large subunit (GpA)
VPYLREPMDCLHPDNPARRVTVKASAQVGKSEIGVCWFCFIVDRSPGPMLTVLPATAFKRFAGGFNQIVTASFDAPSSREFSSRTRWRMRGDASIVGWIFTRLYLIASAPVKRESAAICALIAAMVPPV